MLDIIIIGILAIWLLVTVIFQFQPRFKRILKWPDFFLFAMRTRLFVRVPSCMHISYRDRPDLGEPGPWRQIAWEADKPWYSLFWAPRFWRELHLIGIVNRVLWMKRRRTREKQLSNVWYHLVVGYVQSFPRSRESRARQFRIVRGEGHHLHEEPAVLFTSEFHQW